jgi:transmembrane sensor
MSQDKRANFNAQISEEAAEWFVEFRTGEINATGRHDFATWIRTSPEHLRAYLEFAALWSQSGALTAHSDLDSDALIALARTQGNVIPLEGDPPRTGGPALEDPGPLHSTPTARGCSPRWLRSMAATLALLVAGGAILALCQFGRGEIYATAVGERRVLRLEDGSSVELNSRSRLRVQFSTAQRNVELLEGQVLFHVAKDPRRPFIVRSEALRVRAVGTEFDINRKTTGTTVTVVEGRVAVYRSGTAEPGSPFSQRPRAGDGHQDPAGPNSAALLCAGEQLTVDDPTQPQRPLPTSPASATAWTRGQLVLESATLTEVAEDFNRYSARHLTVEDRGGHPLRLSGVFATDPEFLLRYLRQRPDITVQESASEIRVIRRE